VKLKLRPHHIYCVHFHSFSHPERGKKYEKALKEIEGVLKNGKEMIEVKEGPDFLCNFCPFYNGIMCIHPNGDEEKIRQWDKKIIDESGLEYGKCIEVQQLDAIIRDKMPLLFCRNRCVYFRQNKCDPEKLIMIF